MTLATDGRMDECRKNGMTEVMMIQFEGEESIPVVLVGTVSGTEKVDGAIHFLKVPLRGSIVAFQMS